MSSVISAIDASLENPAACGARTAEQRAIAGDVELVDAAGARRGASGRRRAAARE